MKEYDKTLLYSLKEQNAEAFAKVYDDYIDVFYRYMKSHYSISEGDIQDILSDIFVKIRQALPRLDVESSLGGFIRTIAKNHIKDFFKRSSDLPFANFNSENSEGEQQAREDMLQDPEDFIASFETSYTYEMIHNTICGLEDTYKDPILLKFVEDMSYEEIASTLNISQDAVRQRISRGLKKLADITGYIK